MMLSRIFRICSKQKKKKNKNHLSLKVEKYIYTYRYLCILKVFQPWKCSQDDYFFNSTYLVSVMYTFNVVFTEEDLGLFASLNWKIHFYFPPGKDGWRALIFEQTQIIGEIIKTKKNSKWYRVYIKDFFSPFLLCHREGAANENEIELK